MQTPEKVPETTPPLRSKREKSDESTRWGQIKPILKWLIVLVVLLFLGLTIARAYRDVQSHRDHLDFSKMDWRFLLLGTLVYALGMVPAGIAWLQTLSSFRQTVPFWFGMHTYFLGHMGKYVPGKAMVIVLRAGRLHPIGVELKPTVVSVFVETLTSVCTGAILGSLLLLTQSPPRWMWIAVGVVVPSASAFLLPHTFRGVLAVLAKSKIGRMPKSVNEAFTWPLMLRTCAWMVLGWTLNGTAAWLIVGGIHSTPELWTLNGWMACVSAVSLAAVVGFVSMLPSGAVARELVITWLLTRLVTEPTALFAAIAFRIANLIAEFAVVGLLTLANRNKKKPEA